MFDKQREELNQLDPRSRNMLNLLYDSTETIAKGRDRFLIEKMLKILVNDPLTYLTAMQADGLHWLTARSTTMNVDTHIQNVELNFDSMILMNTYKSEKITLLNLTAKELLDNYIAAYWKAMGDVTLSPIGRDAKINAARVVFDQGLQGIAAEIEIFRQTAEGSAIQLHNELVTEGKASFMDPYHQSKEIRELLSAMQQKTGRWKFVQDNPTSAMLFVMESYPLTSMRDEQLDPEVINGVLLPAIYQATRPADWDKIRISREVAKEAYINLENLSRARHAREHANNAPGKVSGVSMTEASKQANEAERKAAILEAIRKGEIEIPQQ